MPPIVKDAENQVATATSNPPAAPATKAALETPARPQPVALEIPVTVNGARTVEGSDKREPFSESTKTVLVFGHGAVVRIVSCLAAGQLIFLTNEKTKKEVVCQVVKSKSDGTSAGYVELKFTEPAAGFWGMRFPAERLAPGPVAPAAPRAVSPAMPAAPKFAPPPAPVATKPTAAPAPSAVVSKKPAAVAPLASVVEPEPVESPAPVDTVDSTPLPSVPVSVVPEAPVAPPAVPVVTVIPAPLELPLPAPDSVDPASPAVSPSVPVSVVPEAPVAPPPPPPAVIPSPLELPQHDIKSVDLEPPTTLPDAPIAVIPEARVAPPPAPPAAVMPGPVPAPPRFSFAQQMSTLFAAPPISAPEPLPPAPPELKQSAESSESSSDQLKQQAALLQEQLSSLLFTEASATPPAPPSTPPPVVLDTAQKLLELAQVEPKPEIKRDPKPSVALLKLASTSLAAAEEVKIPSWLAPLSPENAAVVAEPIPSAASSAISDSLPAYTESPEKSLSSLEETPHRSPASVFGGQLLGESADAPSEVSKPGSKKGLLLGLAAAILLFVGGGIWYLQNSGYLQLAASPTQPAAVHPAKAVLPASSNPVSNPEPPPVSSSVNPAPVLSTPESAVATPAASSVPSSTNSNTAARNTPPVEQPTKPAFGKVHLSAPVVSRSAAATQGGDPDIVLDASEASSSHEPIGGLAATHPDAPEAPATPVAIGGDVKPAQLLHSVPPVYPQMARTQHVSGDVRIDALIDADGNVTTMKVLSGPPQLHLSAMAALKQWKYQPAQLDGKPTAMHLTVTVQFRLQ